ncbi:GNAT family N-acetyltransferase [Anaerorhabdus furcosa]|uniref:Protein N-acetyltransferase, RimJ/RimL family n=1 Tax=Anaerorhabdus furcosa TaxID=118967 RepID=A0A1T4N504_9FIRM|nr:GNAT family N-acetyltransferase [Anaerorhabdus furcosa]SJZ74181.1 Protein N-acetyltransferase, RimJ/RimL family [Anaerorhabdus furcosa]
MIKYIKLEDKDINLFKKWLKEPHVAAWYEDPEDWIEEVEKRNGKYNWLHHFIVEVDDVPIGFCQYYELKNSGETWHGDTSLEGTYSLDYLIGETQFLSKGYGKQIIQGLTKMIESLPNAQRVLALPNLKNLPSCKTFESCGYLFDDKNELYQFEFK